MVLNYNECFILNVVIPKIGGEFLGSLGAVLVFVFVAAILDDREVSVFGEP